MDYKEKYYRTIIILWIIILIGGTSLWKINKTVTQLEKDIKTAEIYPLVV